MRGEDEARSLVHEQFERRQGFLDAGHIVDDHPSILLLDRHIVIDADKNAFSSHVQVFDRQLRHKKITGATG